MRVFRKIVGLVWFHEIHNDTFGLMDIGFTEKAWCIRLGSHYFGLKVVYTREDRRR